MPLVVNFDKVRNMALPSDRSMPRGDLDRRRGNLSLTPGSGWPVITPHRAVPC